MRTYAVILLTLTFIACIPLSANAQAPSDATASPSSGSMMPGGSGGMMDMMGMMHPAIAVDANAVYIVSGDQVYKLRKSDLSVLAVTTLPKSPANPAMSSMGGGPGAMIRPEMNQKMQQMRGMTASKFERMFLQNMIRHHQGAIDMSRLAIVSAVHPELREFAQKTIDNQGREQKEFASWLKGWYKASASFQATPEDAQMTEHLKHHSGRDFEIQFMQDMISHHAEAVQMGTDAQQKAPHPEVKTAAANIVSTQSAEIKQLQDWLASWYGVTTGGIHTHE